MEDSNRRSALQLSEELSLCGVLAFVPSDAPQELIDFVVPVYADLPLAYTSDVDASYAATHKRVYSSEAHIGEGQSGVPTGRTVVHLGGD